MMKVKTALFLKANLMTLSYQNVRQAKVHDFQFKYFK